ncbi:MAG: DUF4352 domain-containing protein [Chloroflexota bacterium]|nr:DUF4352 domain-containing protein [Chloroflexota bacterium]
MARNSAYALIQTPQAGTARATPVPLGEVAPAGPWRLSVLEVVSGADATAQVTAASQVNDPPREGFGYLLVRVLAENSGAAPLSISGDDFLLTGASGIGWRFIGAIGPEPRLDGVVETGQEREGWAVFAAPVDETNLLLLFDSLTLSGNWADRVFALAPDAAIAPVATAAAEPNSTGVDPANPATRNQPMVTAEWEVELLEVLAGIDVYNLYPANDYRTTALGAADSEDNEPWLALQVRVRSVRSGDEPAFLSPTAFILATSDGAAFDDVITLTPPNPDASGVYYPGGDREGWVVFELPSEYRATGQTLVRFLPFRTDPDPRYISYGV